jgi:hypothetical protein
MGLWGVWVGIPTKCPKADNSTVLAMPFEKLLRILVNINGGFAT